MVNIQTKPKIEEAKVKIEYMGKRVQGRKLRVYSGIPMNIKSVWNNVKKPELL